MIFDLLITGDHTIDGESNLKTVLESIMNYQSLNDVLFRSKQTNVEPAKIKKILFIFIGFRILTLQYRPDDNEILFNLGKIFNGNIILALDDLEYWLNIHTK